MCRTVGVGEWLDEFWIVSEEGKVALLLGKGIGINNDGGGGRMLVYWLGRW